MLNFDFNSYMLELKDSNKDYDEYIKKIKQHFKKKESMLDWVDVSSSISDEEIKTIIDMSNEIKENGDVLVVCGIGGSYLGAKAIIDIFKKYFNNKGLEIIFMGWNLSSEYNKELLEYIKDKSVYVNVVSKSGETLEPKIAFDLLEKELSKKYSKEELSKRIIVTTDKSKGSLKNLADLKGYRSLVVRDNIGGRYSVLSTVGLLVISCANIDINKLLLGASNGKKYIDKALEYAIIRDKLYMMGRVVESYTIYEPKLYYFSEWLKQLFGETQGKNGKGILPISLVNTRDLHSLGQHVQDGTANMFETVILIENNPRLELDNFNKSLDEINNIAALKVCKAHFNGNTPSLIITLDELKEETIGELIYFFEISASSGGYLLDVDPFNQPGVNEYKNLLYKEVGEK